MPLRLKSGPRFPGGQPGGKPGKPVRRGEWRKLLKEDQKKFKKQFEEIRNSIFGAMKSMPSGMLMILR